MSQADGTPGVQKLSVKHTEIMNFMLVNPTIQLADVARHFGMSQPWLSCVIHSEAFQAELATKKDAIFSGTVLPIKEKMTALAHQALDQISQRMPVMDDKVVAQIADNTLDKLGFGSKAPPPAAPGQPGAINISVTLRQELEEARRYIGATPATRPALEVLVDGQPAPLGIGGPAQVYDEDRTLAGATGPAIPVAADQGAGPALSQGNQV